MPPTVAIVDPPVSPHSDGGLLDERQTPLADESEARILVGDDDVGHDASSDSRHESPVEQEDGQRTEDGSHLGHAGGADEEAVLILAMMARLLNIIWPVDLVLRYLFRRRE